MAEYTLIDNVDKRRYEFQIDGKVAQIDYIKSQHNQIFLVHTEVPISLGGQGIASQLVQKALEDIELKGLKLVPLCPFVAGYIKKHPEWKGIVLPGFHVG
ncbi:MAG: N-acetyltransferase [Mediterranea sp.]|jgi:predicted GNAT family acetyltransferase|nr:N-acetyltransferase [Mediterranea sp.]